ncbi:hypothetical protein [Rhodopirellula sp. MGV]|uniref:hypothetical protein n=1 Tax=Rhodopirellula sp. MGV TaxID=2023130 RepID=UPI00117B8BF1|nr:hypothetical protein [Rhodopirellula sp. MGV]
MTLVSSLVVGLLESERIRFMALRNSVQWDEARYLAEAGVHAAIMNLESDFQWRTGVQTTEFPPGSGRTYSVTLSDNGNGTVDVHSEGRSGSFSRYLDVTIKQGG